MNMDDLNKIKFKIAEDDIDIKNKDFLRDLYNLDDYKATFDELDRLNKEITFHKVENSLIYIVGFFNLIEYEDINKLPEFTKINSYNILKGGLIKYFKGHFHLTNHKKLVKPYGNYYTFIDISVIIPFEHSTITKLLYWIYISDKKLFFKLHYLDESNYYFLKLFKSNDIENFEINEEHIDFECEDELKNYIIFYYLTTNYLLTIDKELPEPDKRKIESDFLLIEKMEINILIKMILDFIRDDETNKIPKNFLRILKENEELFFKIFESLEIYNLNEINSFIFFFKETILNKEKFSQLLLNKLEKLLNKDYITIENNEWELFLKLIPNENTPKIKILMENLINDLIFTSDFDKEIRPDKYHIDKNKEQKLHVFFEILNEFN